ncbi:hypothetical protein M2427_000983 [Bradyrhizobium sp. BR13661]|jgi:hypothetical protein|nr:hypothetical protein [Bradyrhizobium sp. BR13661]
MDSGLDASHRPGMTVPGVDRGAYFPVNTALRFSMKACTASL